MRFFLSAEAQAGAASMLIAFHRATEPFLNTLKSKDYGPELADISIITIMVRRELLEDGGYPERRLFQKKTHSADVRLRMDFLEFLNAAPEQRYRLYCRHIVSSIESLRPKVSRSFRFDDLIQDVTKILESYELHQKLCSMKRFP